MILTTQDKDIELQKQSLDTVDEEFKVLNENRDYIAEWLSYPDKIKTLNQAKTASEQSIKLMDDGQLFVFNIKYKGEIVGRIKAFNIKDFTKKCEFEFWVAEKYQGRGIATVACKAVMNYVFGDLKRHRIYAQLHTKNYRAFKTMVRCGFEVQATLIESAVRYGKFEDVYIMAILDRNFTY